MQPRQVFGAEVAGPVHSNFAVCRLIEMAVQRNEGLLASNGAFVAYTAPYTGRVPKDKYLVRRPECESTVHWGSVNQPLDLDHFHCILSKARQHLQQRELFVFEGWACADPAYRVPVRVIAEHAWHALFSNLLLRPAAASELADFTPELTIYHAPDLKLAPSEDGTRSDVGVILDVVSGDIVIAGTGYAGEIKKAVFTYLNYCMPDRGVFPMHCSAMVSPRGDSALLFGLSGTGKTTLSADPHRRLIGDDEHGWSDRGVFNFEGGCYAKCIRLSEQGEPEIYRAVRFGSVLENVVLDEATRVPDFNSDRLTENTRAAYPLGFIPSIEPSSMGGHPPHVLFLTCDATGVLPPLSRLTLAQAQYHFLSGYTAKVAGTETGVREPAATFSTCFALPFLPRRPADYARLLRERLVRHNTQVWLVNTGWTGGGLGVGRRMPLDATRRLVNAALDGELDQVPHEPDPIFGLQVPCICDGVPTALLRPRQAWANAAAYDRETIKLARQFQQNFTQHAPHTTDDVRQAGPRA